MNKNIKTILLIIRIILFILIGIFALLLILDTILLPRLNRINPVGLTRHILRVCEECENELLLGISTNIFPKDLNESFNMVIMKTEAFREGYIKVNIGERTNVLDAWGQPLQIMIKSNLLTISNVSPKLLAKTNEIIIWSIGPNKSNEFGNGDDIFIPLSSINK